MCNIYEIFRGRSEINKYEANEDIIYQIVRIYIKKALAIIDKSVKMRL